MILNISRAGMFQQCRRKVQYWHIQGLRAHREADPLLIGGAFHFGVANWFSTKDIELAAQATEKQLRDRLTEQKLLPEEVPQTELMIEQTVHAVRKYAENFQEVDFEVLQPECQFLVPFPGTEHHCHFFHRILHPGTPNEGCTDSKCIHPHYIKGTADGVIQWNKMVWLLEHKTTSMTGELFFRRWILDFQPTGYIYGIWKATGLRPHGFILSIVKKPQKRAKDQFLFGFEREPFIKSDEELAAFEKDFVQIAEDYEDMVVRERFYRNPKACFDYNRACYYHPLCCRFGDPLEGEFTPRTPDYVDKEYYNILNMEVPV